jgi:hypothetical protein
MKTIMMLNIVRAMGPDVPTLYHSSDSDDFTMATRVNSMMKDMESNDSELEIMLNPDLATDALKQFSHVKWSFHAAPTLDHMWREAEAFREVHGTYPHHTIIDILMDVDYEGAGEQNYWALMAELKVLSRDQQTALTIVHHTSESAKGGSPPPRSAIMGKANQLPTCILTLWGDSRNGTIDVAVVKNRFGPQDPMALHPFRMTAKPSVCQIEEMLQEDVPLLFHDGVGVDAGINLFEEDD